MTTSPELLLTVWLSPSFPVGAFAYSHGLEWAVEAGDVADVKTLVAWLTDLVEHGSARNDCILFAEAFRATRIDDRVALAAVNELAIALAPSSERRLEAMQQGRSFLDAIASAWPAPGVAGARDVLDGDVAYPVAVGLAAGAHDIPLPRACEAYVLGFVANLVSAAVRLSVVGQTQGQAALAALAPAISALGAFAAQSSLDDLGSAAFRSDISSMRHETQYSRLFRS
ncbi:MAG: urease accessory protein UreF [Hyphomicrobiales bacterium]|nr:urease accessory protein UreF [Hyphomicrobiales bacterium]